MSATDKCQNSSDKGVGYIYNQINKKEQKEQQLFM